MAIPILKTRTYIGIKEEATEGTYLAPAATTDYIQPLEDGFEFTPSRDLIERNLLTNNLGSAAPRLGMRQGAGVLPCEYRASGTEGADVDFGLLLKGALGDSRAIATTSTTKATGNTGAVLQIQDADISKYAVGDIVVVKEAAGHHVAAITARATGAGVATITLQPTKSSGSFSASVVVSKSQMYLAGSSHPVFSLSYYLGNEVVQKIIGARVSSMQLEGYQTGGLASLKFGFDCLDWDEIDGAAPHTPAFDTGTPPVLLDAKIYVDGTSLDLNNLGLNVQNDLGFLTSLASSVGRSKGRVTNRKVTGTLNPYKDDATFDFFTKFKNITQFALFARAYTPSATAGEFTMGSVLGIYLPRCVLTGYKFGEVDGLLVDDLAFQATGGDDGSNAEIYMGLI